MAIIMCPECQNEVSDKAAACPKCGCPINASAVTNTVYVEKVKENVEEKKKNEGKLKFRSILGLIFAFVGFKWGFFSFVGLLTSASDIDKSKKDGRKKSLDVFVMIICIITLIVKLILLGGTVGNTTAKNSDHNSSKTESQQKNTNEKIVTPATDITVGGLKFTIPAGYESDGNNQYSTYNSIIVIVGKSSNASDALFISNKNTIMSNMDQIVSSAMRISWESDVTTANIDGMSAIHKTYQGLIDGKEAKGNIYLINNDDSGYIVTAFYAGLADATNEYKDFDNMIKSVKASLGGTSTSTSTTSSTGDITPEVKEFLDSYEKFVDDYVKFMKNYMNNPSNMSSMLNDYNKILSALQEYENKLSQLNESNLSAADYKYYLEVVQRCNNKMLAIYN